MERLFRAFCSVALVLFLAGCGQSSATGPDAAIPEGVVVSELGFRVRVFDYHGPATTAHAELADRWWGELLEDLHSAGYSEEQTDPNRNTAWVFISLHEPVDGTGNIIRSQDGATVGGYYDFLTPALHVPGTYPTASWPGRSNAQALKHEMLHHWCWRTFQHMCLQNGDERNGHFWPAQNDPQQNIWDLQWR